MDDDPGDFRALLGLLDAPDNMLPGLRVKFIGHSPGAACRGQDPVIVEDTATARVGKVRRGSILQGYLMRELAPLLASGPLKIGLPENEKY